MFVLGRRGLIQKYTEVDPSIEIIGYINGYHGLLLGNSVQVTQEVRDKAPLLHKFGGSPIGNSRVKLTNVEDCVKRGLVQPARTLCRWPPSNSPKTAWTSCTPSAATTPTPRPPTWPPTCTTTTTNSRSSVCPRPSTTTSSPSSSRWGMDRRGTGLDLRAEHNRRAHLQPRMLIIHEVMGRNCGWLTAATAVKYREWLDQQEWNPGIGLDRRGWDVHAVFVPEMAFDIAAEAQRLLAVMDEVGCVNIFLSEGPAWPRSSPKCRRAAKRSAATRSGT